MSHSVLSRRQALAATLLLPAVDISRQARSAVPLRIGYQKNGSLVILRQQNRLASGDLRLPLRHDRPLRHPGT